MKIQIKPNWWPRNPYPDDIFVMTREEVVLALPDPNLRTAIAGCLGRVFWDLTSDDIWEIMKIRWPTTSRTRVREIGDEIDEAISPESLEKFLISIGVEIEDK